MGTGLAAEKAKKRSCGETAAWPPAIKRNNQHRSFAPLPSPLRLSTTHLLCASNCVHSIRSLPLLDTPDHLFPVALCGKLCSQPRPGPATDDDTQAPTHPHMQTALTTRGTAASLATSTTWSRRTASTSSTHSSMASPACPDPPAPLTAARRPPAPRVPWLRLCRPRHRRRQEERGLRGQGGRQGRLAQEAR